RENRASVKLATSAAISSTFVIPSACVASNTEGAWRNIDADQMPETTLGPGEIPGRKSDGNLALRIQPLLLGRPHSDGHPKKIRPQSTDNSARPHDRLISTRNGNGQVWSNSFSLQPEISRVPRGFRVFRIHRRECFAHDRSHCRIACPFVIRRNH